MGRIVDIAEKAGVSTKTVSRVLNGHPNISEKTRRKVEDAIAELSYHPRSAALRSEHYMSRGLGVLFGDPAAGYQVRLYRALLDACREQGYYLAIDAFDESSKDWGQQVQDFLDRSQVKRLILVPPMCDSFEIQQLLKSRGIRFSLISPSRPVSGVHSLDILICRKQCAHQTQNFLANLLPFDIGNSHNNPVSFGDRLH